jgi:hypothetical protein
MTYREVCMEEVKEVLRLWLRGQSTKRIASRIGLDPKTVRRYLHLAVQAGLQPEQGEAALSEPVLTAVLTSVRGQPGREHGQSWEMCEQQRERIARWLKQGVRLSKVQRLLVREQVVIPYPTLHRWAVSELDFGRSAPTILLAEGKPGEELQVDTGWVGRLEPDVHGRIRKFRAWIFTAVVSRYRFVWPSFYETTAAAIEACEAAWSFFGGIFRVLLPDNTPALVKGPDHLYPKLNPVFLEYSQFRGFEILGPELGRLPRAGGFTRRYSDAVSLSDTRTSRRRPDLRGHVRVRPLYADARDF